VSGKSGAFLPLADLSEVYLRGANFKFARGGTDDQLSEARSLDDATMPNGQKYEDWLKSKGSEE
jgi:hypothetical protein